MGITVIAFILILALLIFVHELGHFLAAKKMGIQVDEFAIGFPPRMFSWKKGNTDYSLNWLPLGGYVKIKGEAGEDADDEDSFAHKKIWQRAFVLSAGVLMNFLTAMVLLSFAFMIGLPLPVDEANGGNIRDERIQIVSVLSGSQADQAGIQPGDVIESVNGQSYTNVEEVQSAIQSDEDAVDLVLSRSDEQVSISATAEYNEEVDAKVLGIELLHTGIVSYNPIRAVYEGVTRTFFITGRMIDGLISIIASIFTVEQEGVQVAGPVGIAVLTGQVVKLGFASLLQFAAFLSINLALINILPFPALDGGRLVFLVIEKIKGSPVDAVYEAIIHNLGFALLMILMVFITFADISRYSDQIWRALTGLLG